MVRLLLIQGLVPTVHALEYDPIHWHLRPSETLFSELC